VSARRKARKRALDFLYEADIRSARAIDLLESRGEIELSEREYVFELLLGVETNALKIDELITTYAQGWDMDRMPAVDRNILRISLFEILFKNDLDDQIAASEAVEIATELSTEDSAKYINGILGRIIILKPSFAL
jgi:transcription antitermination protein NusB